MMEAGVVIAGGKPVFWHLPPGRTGGSLPDSRDLWDVLWEHRESLDGFAHSHPGSGWPGASHTDITTFRAIERGLGKKLKWWITSMDRMVLLVRDEQTSREAGELTYLKMDVEEWLEPPWVWKLREHSYVPEAKRAL